MSLEGVLPPPCLLLAYFAYFTYFIQIHTLCKFVGPQVLVAA